jgi:AraC family transcriptional regulator
MLLNIKNMVCDRCIQAVHKQLEEQGFKVENIGLGTALVSPEPAANKLQELKIALTSLGFDLIDDNRSKLVERIKNEVIQTVHHAERLDKINFAELLANQLHKEYGYLSRTFSDHEELTLEKFIIFQKVEKIKALLHYNELSFSEIAWQMGYSSSSHLSTQFKAVTGISPRAYKSKNLNDRKRLDEI